MSFEEKTSRSLGELLAEGGSVEGLYSELRACFDLEKSNASSGEQLKRTIIGSRPRRAS